ncbi:hypothetical protein [uncultured Mitsuokella sp.]|uniref:hypothetical protein n=1 Tax=uncultured Mitsuokella sp. TaxID=453120 RepID=UPI00266F2A5C|nr:hypothetical protein [uncultured Mitsuokella sp.]
MNAHHNLLALAAAGVILFSHGNVFANADTEAMQMASTPGDAAIAAETADTAAASEQSAADTAAADTDAAAGESDATAAASDTSAAAADTQTADIAGVPNPMVPYSSYTEMATALDFHPLYFPLSSGLELQQRFVIGGTVADLRYASRYGQPEKRAQFTVRTAVADPSAMTAETLSGVYGADWQTQTIGDTSVQLAEVSDSSFVAYWAKDGFVFSVGAENVNRWDFLRQVRDNLIDLTEHYY